MKSSCGTARSLHSLLPPGSASSCANGIFSFWYPWSLPSVEEGHEESSQKRYWPRQESVHVEMGHKVPWDRQSSRQRFSPFARPTLGFPDKGACLDCQVESLHQNSGFLAPSQHSCPKTDDSVSTTAPTQSQNATSQRSVHYRIFVSSGKQGE